MKATNTINEVNPILEGPVVKLLLQQSLPIFIGMLFQLLYNITDAVWVSKIDMNDPSYVGAVGIVFPLFYIAIAFAGGLVTGTSSLVARATGSNNQFLLQKAYGASVFIAVILALCFLSMGYLFSNELLMLFGAKNNYLVHALEYYYYLLPGVVLLFIGSIYVGLLQGKGIMQPVMIGMLIATVCNIGLDPLLIFTFGLKMKGAALATTISQFLAVIYIAASYYKTEKISISLKFDLAVIKEINTVGMSQSIGQILIGISIIIFNIFIIRINENALSAFAICSRFDQVVYLPIIAISTALVTTIGQNYGNQNYKRVEEFWKAGNKIALIIVFILATLLIILAPVIFRNFSNIEEVVYYAVLQARLMGYSILFVVITVLAGSYFQAINKPSPAIMISLLRLIAIPLPIIITISLLTRLTIVNILLSMVVSNILSAVICWIWTNKTNKKLQLNAISAPEAKVNRTSVEL